MPQFVQVKFISNFFPSHHHSKASVWTQSMPRMRFFLTGKCLTAYAKRYKSEWMAPQLEGRKGVNGGRKTNFWGINAIIWARPAPGLVWAGHMTLHLHLQPGRRLESEIWCHCHHSTQTHHLFVSCFIFFFFFFFLNAKLPESLNFQNDIRWCTTELQDALSPTPRQSSAWFASVPGHPRVNAASHTSLGSAQKLSLVWMGPLRKVAVCVSDTLSITNKTYDSYFLLSFFSLFFLFFWGDGNDKWFPNFQKQMKSNYKWLWMKKT